MSFQMCNHGYVALTCPSCRMSPVRTAPVVAPVADARPHYSGASAQTRKQLAQAWPNILQRAVDRIDQSSFRQSLSEGQLSRRQVEI